MIEEANLIFAQNLVFIGFSLLVALVFAVRLISSGSLLAKDVRYLMLGVALVAFGSMSHRFWWMLWGLFKKNEYDPFNQWALTNSIWITSPSVALVAIGYGFHLYPLTSRLWPKYWKWSIAGFAVVLWSIGIML